MNNTNNLVYIYYLDENLTIHLIQFNKLSKFHNSANNFISTPDCFFGLNYVFIYMALQTV